MQKKNIAILGSTGSIGTQALEVIQEHQDKFNVEILTARSNADLLIEQAILFSPKIIVITDKKQAEKVKTALSNTNIKIYSDENSLAEVVQGDNIDIVLTALVGYAGLLPTLNALKAKKTIALANKETLVVAGELVMNLAKKNNCAILPVDSEHSAVFQCLVGENYQQIEKVILTASGGPFRGKTTQDLLYITKAQALKHPNWTMGAKITIDSASLMNKGLEVIEAKWLFELENNQIDVVVHPQSIVHSLVQFKDGSIKAQLGLPDMKLPIQYALGFPDRLTNNFPRFNFLNYPQLTFESPDFNTFKNLSLAFEALKKGGNMPCILNAANEIAVEKFLQDKISFLGMSDLIANAMQKITFIQKPVYEDYVLTDIETRKLAQEYKN
ncbi:MAG: 1-deoxy-D-xylulose-5-phosphate reductoisomerase [Bacteroidetes bacterium]|nr:MAG: 1-deoxy-D-xylulose-5-phosphate reductoisomerase [Bacteroidota bacterium]TAG89658.1 MAG: 1-deoxy-D-xylulose-5-phosphate reductoisomerase [Bacteroidota bacterium]